MTRRQVFRLSIAALVFSTASCDPASYPEVGTDLPFAIITLSKGQETGLGVGSNQVYSISANGRCSDTEKAANFNWTTSDTKNVRIAAGHRTVVLASTTYITGGGADVTECGGAASFVPDAGHTYTVAQRAPLHDVCYTLVVDTATGKPPDTLRVSSSANCSGFANLN